MECTLDDTGRQNLVVALGSRSRGIRYCVIHIDAITGDAVDFEEMTAKTFL